jgi:hypothetical protein
MKKDVSAHSHVSSQNLVEGFGLNLMFGGMKFKTVGLIIFYYAVLTIAPDST